MHTYTRAHLIMYLFILSKIRISRFEKNEISIKENTTIVEVKDYGWRRI